MNEIKQIIKIQVCYYSPLTTMGQLMGTNRQSVTIMKMCLTLSSTTKKFQLQKIPITIIPTKKLQASIQVVF